MTLDIPVDQMSVEEKLEALETIWENLRRNENNIPAPQWHKDLLDQRERLVREGGAKFGDWEAAKARISKRAREN